MSTTTPPTPHYRAYATDAPPADPTTLGGRVRLAREAKGWSMKDLAAHSGVPYVTVWQVERKHRGAHANTLFKLATALGVSMDRLMGRGEKEQG